MFTWPCAPVLGQFILHNKEMCIGKNVLEVLSFLIKPAFHLQILSTFHAISIVVQEQGLTVATVLWASLPHL